MKYVLTIMITLSLTTVIAQEALHNFGNLKIHDQGALGFHTNLINDGAFENNEGLAGFYNDDIALTVSGNNRPVFEALEIDVENDLFLETSLGVSDIVDYINGRVVTPRNIPSISFDFLTGSIYINDSDDTHVDGYASVDAISGFTFPVGDDFRLRPLRLQPSDASLFDAAYFYEDPNSPSTFNESFTTQNFEPSISIVSDLEFWDLNGTVPTAAVLTWDDQSAIEILANNLNDLRVVGFSVVQNRWIDLGNTATQGDFNEGSITSITFQPQDYEVITIGSVLEAGGAIFAYDIFTPNGDGMNDTFVIRGIEAFPDNELFIYNRWGVEVYNKRGYDNSFDGMSDGRATVKNGDQLPVGTYYFILKLNGRDDIAGPLYINR